MAVDELIAEHLGWAREIARSVHAHLPPAFDLEDLTQTARIALWRSASRYDEARGVPFRSYAYRAVRGAYLMSVRRRAWRETVHVSLKDRHEDPRPDSLDDSIDRARRREQLRGLIAGLPDGEREVITGHYACGLPMALVSRRLGRGLSTVYHLRERALGRLRSAV